MNELLSDLTAMRRLIAAPEHWCQRWFAHTADGSPCQSTDPRAASWCVFGAAHKVIAPDKHSTPRAIRMSKMIYFLEKHTPPGHASKGVTGWQDQATHAEVIKWLDEVIEKASALD